MAAADKSMFVLLDGTRTAADEGRTDDELELGGFLQLLFLCALQNSRLLCGTKAFFRLLQLICS